MRKPLVHAPFLAGWLGFCLGFGLVCVDEGLDEGFAEGAAEGGGRRVLEARTFASRERSDRSKGRVRHNNILIVRMCEREHEE